MKQYKILFVCMGNICRSPAGEAVLRKMVGEEGLQDQILIDSAGTIGFHSGNAPDRRMHNAAAKRGIRTGGKARQVKLHDFDEFDRVLAMDDENYDDLTNLAGNPAQLAKIKRFCEYCRSHPEHHQVPDPYYGGDAGFELVLDLLEDGCQQLLQEAKEALV